jgi:hypothetical protein
MANMASVAYAIEGTQESLLKIKEAINKAVNDKETKKYEEYFACLNLGFAEKFLENYRLGGEISEEVEIRDDVLRFWAEERWGLQDFEELLRLKFPDITVYWIVEECGMEIYCTNDKEGKYFSDKYWVDTAQDGVYQSEYFKTEEAMYKWLSEITNGRVKNKEDVEAFNSDYEDSCAEDENFIYIHEFEVVE